VGRSPAVRCTKKEYFCLDVQASSQCCEDAICFCTLCQIIRNDVVFVGSRMTRIALTFWPSCRRAARSCWLILMSFSSSHLVNRLAISHLQRRDRLGDNDGCPTGRGGRAARAQRRRDTTVSAPGRRPARCAGAIASAGEALGDPPMRFPGCRASADRPARKTHQRACCALSMRWR
jgi:hypothetical protein